MAPMINRTTPAVDALPVLVATALVMAFVVAACGNSVPPTESPSPTPAASHSLQPASPSPTMLGTNAVTTFESTEYA